MRARSVTAVLFVMILVPKGGNAQVYRFETPPPQVTASTAWWQIQSVPIEFDGLVYQPTAMVRPFDRNVMTQVGVFDGVPLYADATREPFSVVFVPVARGMRQYERERTGALAGTSGSQTPSLPVQPVSVIGVGERVADAASPGPAAAAGTVRPRATVPATRALDTPGHRRIATVLPRRSTDGVWIRYDGVTWYSDGEAVPYTSERFTQIGTYHGFPVYRERRGGSARDIWVAVVQDGPVAPYARR